MGRQEFGRVGEEEEMGRHEFGRFGYEEDEEDGWIRISKIW